MKTLIILFSLLWSITAYAQDFEWARDFKDAEPIVGIDVETDSMGNVFTLGVFRWYADMDPSSAGNQFFTNGRYDIFIQKMDPEGNFLWAKQIGGPEDDFPTDMQLDKAGNIYCSGHFEGTVDFDPNAGLAYAVSTGQSDVFVLKLDNSGNFKWVQTTGGPDRDIAESIALDPMGNVITTGSFLGTVDFDPSANTFLLSSNGQQDLYVQKLDSSGNFKWAVSQGGLGYFDIGEGVGTDANGNVYVTGTFEGTVDFDPSTANSSLTATGSRETFIEKFDENGVFLWANSISTDPNGASHPSEIAVDSAGNAFVTGSFWGTCYAATVSGVVSFTSAGSSDFYIFKIKGDGLAAWGSRIGGPFQDWTTKIKVDDGVYVCGHVEGTVDLDPSLSGTFLTSGPGNAFVQKLDTSGAFQWAAGLESPYVNTPWDVAIDKENNVLLTGEYYNTLDFDPGPNVFNLNSMGQSDAFVLKLRGCASTDSTETVAACNDYTWRGMNLTASGSYFDTLPNAAGCDSVLILNLTIQPNVNVVASSGATLTAQAQNSTFQWIDCNTQQAIAGATDSVFQPQQSGSYAVIVNTNGCTDTSACQVVNLVHVAEAVPDDIVLFPNPTSGLVHLDLLHRYPDVKLSICNVMGQTIEEQVFHNTQQVNVEIVGNPGLYLIEVALAGRAPIIRKVLKR